MGVGVGLEGNGEEGDRRGGKRGGVGLGWIGRREGEGVFGKG